MPKYFVFICSFFLLLSSCEGESEEMEFVEICEKPVNLYTPFSSGTAGFGWNHEGSADLYTVEYGDEGFGLGSGTIVNTEERVIRPIPMESGQSYDFYVRAFCDAELGGSEVAGPFKYFSEFGQFQCNTTPSDLTYQIVPEDMAPNSPLIVIASWQGNGEATFEYITGPEGFNPGTNAGGAVERSFVQLSLPTAGSSRDLYVRSVCLSGEKSDWDGPLTIAN